MSGYFNSLPSSVSLQGHGSCMNARTLMYCHWDATFTLDTRVYGIPVHQIPNLKNCKNNREGKEKAEASLYFSSLNEFGTGDKPLVLINAQKNGIFLV